jgi:Family of unknown function (DUF6527)
MRALPLSVIECIYKLPFISRPRFLADAVPECPSREELRAGMVFIEIRSGYLKWVHLLCPTCGDHIQLPLAGRERWSIKLDFLRRPTLAPSIWEKASCGAHFLVRKGKLLWCDYQER